MAKIYSYLYGFMNMWDALLALESATRSHFHMHDHNLLLLCDLSEIFLYKKLDFVEPKMVNLMDLLNQKSTSSPGSKLLFHTYLVVKQNSDFMREVIKHFPLLKRQIH